MLLLGLAMRSISLMSDAMSIASAILEMLTKLLVSGDSLATPSVVDSLKRLLLAASSKTS